MEDSKTYLDIELKPVPLQPKRRLIISDEVIKWGDKSMSSREIVAVKYGSIAMGTMGIQTNQNHSFKFKDKSDSELAIYFSSVSIAAPNQKLEDAFRNIEDAVWNAVTVRILDQWIDDLHNDKSVTVGDVTLSPAGVKIKVSKLFSSNEAMINWNDTDKGLDNGYLYVKSKVNKKDKCSMNIQNEWNAITLYYLFNWLWKENRISGLMNKTQN